MSEFVSLSEQIQELQTQLSAHFDRYQELENDIDFLKNLIRSFDEDGSISPDSIVRKLQKWANPDE